MQTPHVPSVKLKTLPLSITVFLQRAGSTNSSLSSAVFQVLPLMALPGHLETQTLQLPHDDRLTGSPVSKGISVNTDVILIACPKSLLTRTADFPIQPTPAKSCHGFMRKEGSSSFHPV